MLMGYNIHGDFINKIGDIMMISWLCSELMGVHGGYFNIIYYNIIS
jgi:hypothetical protein